ncbi:NAD(P)-binding protein [Chloroflexota bacterium]
MRWRAEKASVLSTGRKNPVRSLSLAGGPGGMEAARVAALRGHQVTLFEKTGKLGGDAVIRRSPTL